jgi:DNA-binding response OmpR family regulator
MRALIIEDDTGVANSLYTTLKQAGFAADIAYDGEQGSFLARSNNYDLIITDYVMPKMDGFNMIKEIREDGCSAPILMLSVRISIDDKVNILDIGADDYLCKPYIPEEFIARAKALTRRPPQINMDPVIFHDLRLEIDTFRVTRNNKVIRLTNKEFSLLHHFMTHPTKIISRDSILEHVWNGEIDPFSNTLETHIMRLRQKIDKTGPKLIHNITGRGYKLDINP